MYYRNDYRRLLLIEKRRRYRRWLQVIQFAMMAFFADQISKTWYRGQGTHVGESGFSVGYTGYQIGPGLDPKIMGLTLLGLGAFFTGLAIVRRLGTALQILGPLLIGAGFLSKAVDLLYFGHAASIARWSWKAGHVFSMDIAGLSLLFGGVAMAASAFRPESEAASL